MIHTNTVKRHGLYYYFFMNKKGKKSELMFGSNQQSRSETYKYGKAHAWLFRNGGAEGFFE